MPERVGHAIDAWLGPRLAAALFAILFGLSAWTVDQAHTQSGDLGRLQQQVDDRGARGDERYSEIKAGFLSIGGACQELSKEWMRLMGFSSRKTIWDNWRHVLPAENGTF